MEQEDIIKKLEPIKHILLDITKKHTLNNAERKKDMISKKQEEEINDDYFAFNELINEKTDKIGSWKYHEASATICEDNEGNFSVEGGSISNANANTIADVGICKSRNKKLVGTFHTHPFGNAIFSKDDLHTATRFNEQLICIGSIVNNTPQVNCFLLEPHNPTKKQDIEIFLHSYKMENMEFEPKGRIFFNRDVANISPRQLLNLIMFDKKEEKYFIDKYGKNAIDNLQKGILPDGYEDEENEEEDEMVDSVDLLTPEDEEKYNKKRLNQISKVFKTITFI